MSNTADRVVAVIAGTRPEAIKLAPVALALRNKPGWTPFVISTGQHGSVVDEVFATFGVEVDRAHAPWDRGTDLAELHATLLQRLSADLSDVRPDVAVVQGDTATTLAGALAAFWRQIPVVHVEAGLRSGDLAAPYPEEANRRLVTQVSSLHLAPTAAAAAALAREGIVGERVLVTGNTVVDALQFIAMAEPRMDDASSAGRRLVLVTCHRRESWGEPMRNVATALQRIAAAHPDIDLLVATHPNPAVQEVFTTALADIPNAEVRGPMPYGTFVRRLAAATIAVTDSGGVQEEAPALGVPVLVMRDVTERPEGIEWGVARLVGTDPELVAKSVSELLDDPVAHAAMSEAVNPYGDGRAAERSVAGIAWLLDGAPRPSEFEPTRR